MMSLPRESEGDGTIVQFFPAISAGVVVGGGFRRGTDLRPMASIASPDARGQERV